MPYVDFQKWHFNKVYNVFCNKVIFQVFNLRFQKSTKIKTASHFKLFCDWFLKSFEPNITDRSLQVVLSSHNYDYFQSNIKLI